MQQLIGALLVAAALTLGNSHGALAAAADFVFEAVTARVPPADGAIIDVRLVNKATGKAVSDAVIFQTRLDMSPEQMPEMATAVAPMPTSEPGIYRFKADLDMAGRWALKLAAKVARRTGNSSRRGADHRGEMKSYTSASDVVSREA